MKKIILLLLLGCCCILSGCHGNETFEENCIGFYKFFTTWQHKCDEYRFIFRDVKNDKKLCETIFSLCRSNGFDFIKETEGYYLDDFDKRGDKELLATRPKFKVFIFFHNTLDAACFYIPEKNELEMSENIPECHVRHRKDFATLYDKFCKSLTEQKIDYRLEKFEWHRVISPRANVKNTSFWYRTPEEDKKIASKYTLIKP